MSRMLPTPLLISLSLKLSQVIPTLNISRHITHISIMHRRLPTNRVPSPRNLSIELINLLERKTLSLIDASIHEKRTDKAEPAPDEEHLGLQVRVSGSAVHHVRGSVGDGPVEEPVGCGRDGETLCAGLEGEEFAGYDPGDGAPGGGEEEDVDADEGDEDFVCDGGGGGCADDGDDQLGDAHADGTEHEEWAATPFLDHVEAGEGGDDVDDVGDKGDDEGVLDARVLEKSGAVVDWKVGC